ncbi:hypothetical protein K432DRAFT_423977 [Lepidopterella palustris CBS 459.81]|uniref:MFS general substrate transporter n=1 Tax=Lepidopterella palustris CBS 459.81 TaxID=1314670 RepID=A0A8E2JHH4_9PEZI|nr:hypothetical protein K432DRAFT_423977 [Lepidopterella palustris CBS 459.81]
MVKKFDWLGIVLYLAGPLLFLLDLSRGGSSYPWRSARVVATIVIGFFALVVPVIWELFADLSKPLVPMHLFKNSGWVPAILLVSLGASVYYGFAIIFPRMVTTVYANGYLNWPAWIIGGFIVEPIRRTKWQVIAVTAIGTALFGSAATSTPSNPSRIITLISFGCFFVGCTESITNGLSTLLISSQTDIGIAASIRSAIATISSTIYTVALITRLTFTISTQVPLTLLSAGLLLSSIPAFLQSLAAGGMRLEAVPGFTAGVLEAGMKAI